MGAYMCNNRICIHVFIVGVCNLWGFRSKFVDLLFSLHTCVSMLYLYGFVLCALPVCLIAAWSNGALTNDASFSISVLVFMSILDAYMKELVSILNVSMKLCESIIGAWSQSDATPAEREALPRLAALRVRMSPKTQSFSKETKSCLIRLWRIALEWFVISLCVRLVVGRLLAVTNIHVPLPILRLTLFLMIYLYQLIALVPSLYNIRASWKTMNSEFRSVLDEAVGILRVRDPAVVDAILHH